MQTQYLGYLLQHVPSVLARQSDQALQERLGIGFSQFKILMVLGWNPSVQQRLIAESLGQTEASISRQIKLMHDKGWLQSSTSPNNRREHVTKPTEKGLRLAEEARRVLSEYYDPMFERLSEKQVAQMFESLATMHNYVCQQGKTGACDHPLGV